MFRPQRPAASFLLVKTITFCKTLVIKSLFPSFLLGLVVAICAVPFLTADAQAQTTTFTYTFDESGHATFSSNMVNGGAAFPYAGTLAPDNVGPGGLPL